ncbi:MAG: serine protease [Planctomycetaceae bacterium]|nr:serine protease [Planctomycetaceae bacterium]
MVRTLHLLSCLYFKISFTFSGLFTAMSNLHSPFLCFRVNEFCGALRILIVAFATFIFVFGSVCVADEFGIGRRGMPLYATSQPHPKTAISSTASVAGANNIQQLQPLPNIARLVAFDKKGQSFGSCSYIGSSGEYGIIVSNWHVICEADGLVHIYFPSGFSSFGAIIQFDSKWDLAVIVISKPPAAIPPLPIMQNIPRPGEPLWIAGYGPGSYRIASGHCVRYLAPEIPRNGSAPSYEIIELSTIARKGDSGGPILNRNGELAGVLFGSDMVNSTAGSYCERVKLFLKQTAPIIEKLPKRPEAFFASIEPTGPRHLLSGNKNNVAPENIPQANTTHTNKINHTTPQHESPQFFHERNNIENITINTADTNNPIIKPQNNSTIYDPITKNKKIQQTTELINSSRINQPTVVSNKSVVPMTNIQTKNEKVESKIAMAILRVAKESPPTLPQEKNNTPITPITQNTQNQETINQNITGTTEVETEAENINSNPYFLLPPISQNKSMRIYFVSSTAIIFSILFYMQMRLLNNPDNENIDLAKEEFAHDDVDEIDIDIDKIDDDKTAGDVIDNRTFKKLKKDKRSQKQNNNNPQKTDTVAKAA